MMFTKKKKSTLYGSPYQISCHFNIAIQMYRNKIIFFVRILDPSSTFLCQKHNFQSSHLEHFHLKCYTANSYLVCFRAKSILTPMKYALPWYSDGLCILIRVQTYQGCQTHAVQVGSIPGRQ